MYRELQKLYQQTCETAHDINRHITALQAWIAGKSTRDGEQYLSDLSAAAKQLQPRIRNQNAILEIILNTAARRCEQEAIQLSLEIEDFPMDFLSDMDTTTIFSNLLDNAIDACMELDRSVKRIEVVLCQKMGLLALRMTNTCQAGSWIFLRGNGIPPKRIIWELAYPMCGKLWKNTMVWYPSGRKKNCFRFP